MKLCASCGARLPDQAPSCVVCGSVEFAYPAAPQNGYGYAQQGQYARQYDNGYAQQGQYDNQYDNGYAQQGQ